MQTREERNGIYKRGNGFQVKLMRGGVRVAETFRTREEAERFAQAYREHGLAALKRMRPRLLRPKIKSISALFDHVDKKRWGGNPNAKRPEEGPRGNALRFIDWIGGRSSPSYASERLV